jgi:hypothetical protein
MKHGSHATILLGTAALLFTAGVQAQKYPDHPVRRRPRTCASRWKGPAGR